MAKGGATTPLEILIWYHVYKCDDDGLTSIRRFDKQLPSYGAGALVAEQTYARQANPAARVRF